MESNKKQIHKEYNEKKEHSREVIKYIIRIKSEKKLERILPLSEEDYKQRELNKW